MMRWDRKANPCRKRSVTQQMPKQVVLAASGYLYVTGFVYSFMAVTVMLFSAYQGGGGQRFRC